MRRQVLIYILFVIVLTYCQQKSTREVVSFYPNGQEKKINIRSLEDGLDFVQLEYYEDGTLKSMQEFLNGEPDGLAVGYFADGDTAMVKYFKRGLPDSVDIKYHENGNVYSRKLFGDGVLIEMQNFWPNGVPTGRLRIENGFIATGTYFYDDYSLRSHGNFLQGIRHGVWVYFHRNGQLKEIGRFEKGKKVGEWSYYDEEGKLVIKEEK